MSNQKPKYSIDVDTGVDHADEGPWRNYQLVAEGNSKEELLADAWIHEIDQDGGDLRSYPAEDARTDVYEAAERIIKKTVGAK